MASDKNECPLVTFALFSYNQERFIQEAVEGALQQDYPRLEIILSDDCSSDSTFEIIELLVSKYTGPHSIIINKNDTNIGLASHFNKIIAQAKGDIIVVAAGDDISLQTRVSKTVAILCGNPGATFASFSDIVIDEYGNERPQNTNSQLAKVRKIVLKDYIQGNSPWLSGASRGFRRSLFDVYGNLNTCCPTEDTPYIVRGLMMGYALVSSEVGIFYRQHGNNLSGHSSMRSMDFNEIRNQYCRDINAAYSKGLIGKELQAELILWAEKNYKKRCLMRAYYWSNKKMRFYFLSILPNSALTSFEKLSMIKNAISSRCKIVHDARRN